jgi:hypothetical protein
MRFGNDGGWSGNFAALICRAKIFCGRTIEVQKLPPKTVPDNKTMPILLF